MAAMRQRERRRPTNGRVAAATTPARTTPHQAPIAGKVLDLQRQAGNQAVVQLLERPKKGDKADFALWDDLFRLARKRIAAESYAEAEQLLRRIYGDPKFTTDDSPGVVLNLGLARHHQGAFGEAIDLYKETLQSTEIDGEYRTVVLEALRDARNKQLPDPPGAKKADPGKPDQADMDLWDDLFRLARKKIAAKDHRSAEHLLRQIYGDPKFRTDDSPGVVLNLGLVRHAVADFDKAIDYYEESVLTNKWGAGEVLDVMDRLREARQKRLPFSNDSGAKATTDRSDDELWQDMFTLARKKIAAKDYDGARSLLQAIYDDPKFTIHGNGGVVLNLAYVHHVKGEYAAAIDRYEEALLGSDWDGAKRARTLEQLKAARLGRPPPG
jgi:tetratricopeptide (TPR) repeat protein